MYIDNINADLSLDDKISFRIMFMQSQNQRDLISEKLRVLSEKYIENK